MTLEECCAAIALLLRAGRADDAEELFMCCRGWDDGASWRAVALAMTVAEPWRYGPGRWSEPIYCTVDWGGPVQRYRHWESAFTRKWTPILESFGCSVRWEVCDEHGLVAVVLTDAMKLWGSPTFRQQLADMGFRFEIDAEVPF